MEDKYAFTSPEAGIAYLGWRLRHETDPDVIENLKALQRQLGVVALEENVA